MATYSSYKKIVQEQVQDGIVSDTKLQTGAGMNRGVFLCVFR